MTPQEYFLFVPRIIYEFGLSLFDTHSLGYGADMAITVFIALIFWVKMYEAVLAVIKKLFGFSSGGRP